MVAFPTLTVIPAKAGIQAPALILSLSKDAYGSEQSRVNPQLRQVILQLRSYIRAPQISQSNPSSPRPPFGGEGSGLRIGVRISTILRASSVISAAASAAPARLAPTGIARLLD